MESTELVRRLAELGRVGVLLEQHPELTADDVAAALRETADLAEHTPPPRAPVSPVYRAYNGFMLGMFTGASMVFDIRGEQERKAGAVRRMTEFLLEFGHEFGERLDPDSTGQGLEDAIDTMVRGLDDELADYYQLGLATFRYVIARLAENDPGEPIEESQALLGQLGHPPGLFQAMEDTKSAGWNDLMTSSLQLAREMLLGMREEADTCFVALPFVETYEKRYLNFYRGAADRMNLRSIRAWGALGHENHQELLLVLLSRCGAILADVTEPNANVTLEVGFALGQNKRVLLVAEGEAWRSTANIELDWVFPYETGDDGDWEAAAAEYAGLYFTTLETLRRPGPMPSWSFKPLEVLQTLVDAMKTSRG